ncbi:MAG: BMP family ABC transporter substrate-binding protein [Desulfovibrionaceae bacterium]|nr:BMP family ABC transporter substrate-binding protein [Desulfovibrionaceae bacterium]
MLKAAFGTRKNRSLPILVLLVLLCALPALCLTAHSALATPLRVALLLESGAGDGGMATLMKKGLESAAAKADIDARVVVCPPDADQTAIFRQAAETSDLVLLAEPRLHMILRDNAANYRRVSFGCVDTGVRAPNIMSVTFADEQAAFLAGAASVMLLAPGQKLGWLEDEEGPVHDNLLAAWMAGAQVQAPDMRVVRRQTGFGGSPAAALGEIAAQNAGLCAVAAGYGTEAALRALAATSMLAAGTDGEHFSAAPERIPFSIVKRYDRAVEELTLARARGEFKGKEILVYDLANGGVDLVLNPAYRKSRGFPKNFENRLNELRREMAAGNIRLEDKRIRTLCDCLD